MAHYLVTELPPLEGFRESAGNCINNLGVIAGTSRDNAVSPNLSSMATTWSGGNFAAPPKGDALPGGFLNTEANAINDLGVAAGTLWSGSESGTPHAIVWTGGTLVRLEKTHEYSEAFGINNAGWVTGYAAVGNKRKPFRWQYPATEMQLGLPDSVGRGNAINDQDAVAGQNNHIAAFFDFPDDQPPLYLLKTDNGYSGANDINNHNVMVGYISAGDNKQRPVRWKTIEGMPDYLDTSFPITRGEATAINNHGQVVGWYTSVEDANKFSAFISNTQFLQTITGPDGILIPLPPAAPAMVDLNTLIDPSSGWHLEFANDINDRGQITGLGIFNGNKRAFRLDPLTPVSLHPYIAAQHPNFITAEIIRILAGVIGGNDGWALTPNGVIRVPGNRPDRSVMPPLDLRVQMLLQNLSNALNNGHASYESRKQMVERVEKFLLSLRQHGRKSSE